MAIFDHPHTGSRRETRGERENDAVRWCWRRVVGTFGWCTLASCCLLILGLGLSACARLPEGRYAIDRVDIEQVQTPGASHLVTISEIEDKIATAPSPHFLGIFPRGVVLDYELYDRYVLERDLTRIERLYRARGYYEAHARAGRVEKVGDGHVKVTLLIEEGLPVNVGEVRVDGLTALPIDDSAAVLAALRRRLRNGRIFDEDKYETAQVNMLRALGDRGYAFAKLKGAVEVDLNRHVADVTFSLAPGRSAPRGRRHHGIERRTRAAGTSRTRSRAG